MIVFDIYNNDINYKGLNAKLTKTEFKILYFMAKKKDYCTSEQLLSHIYETEYSKISSRTISVHIAKIRRKLELINIYDIIIESKYKRGYRVMFKAV